MGILSWILLGLIVGILAKFLMPGNDPGGLVMTIILGIVGASVGGYISSEMGYGSFNGFDLRSILIATCGAVLVLFLFRMLRRSR